MMMTNNKVVVYKTCFGISNKTEDGFQIPFFDYDKVPLLDVIKELKRIQKKYRLTTIYLIKSDNGYNAFSLDKLSYNVLLDLIKSTKYVCPDFIKYSKIRGWFTLRCCYSKKLIKYIYPELPEPVTYQKSLVHKLFFNNIMKYMISDNTNFDNNKRLQFDIYESQKHGVLIE